MDEHDRSRPPQRPDLSSDEALDRLLRRLGPLMHWQEHEDAEPSTPEEGVPAPDLAFERRLRARLIRESVPRPPRGLRRSARGPRRAGRGRVALRVGLAAAALAVMILAAVAVVEVGVIAAITAALALVALAVVLVVRARLGQ